MKLENYIENLQALLKEHGNLDVVYSTDDEGNNHHQVHNEPDVFYFASSEEYYLERVCTEECEVEELEDLYKAVIIN